MVSLGFDTVEAKQGRIMRAFLAGEPTPNMLRVERILDERGWHVDRSTCEGGGVGPYDILVVERVGSDQRLRLLINELRRQIGHELLNSPELLVLAS